MDKEKWIKYLKIASVFVIVVLFLWFLVIHPLLTFKGYESQMEDAAKRYFELNESMLPTGNRVRTVSLQELYDQAYLEEDFYVPLSNNACSITDSWVKVKREDDDYKYYVYLKCGILSSLVDHSGPEVTLKGDDTITVNRGEKYEELGVESVVDNSDGKLDVKDVEIDSSEVDTSVNGTYQVTYTISDSLNNETKKVRTVKVVSRLNKVVSEATGDSGRYVGYNPNNYIYFSNMLFRIIDVDGDNVRITSAQDISSVDHGAIDEWLDYFYDNLTKESKKYVVKNKYCNMTLDDSNVLSTTECNSYTKDVNLSIISFTDIVNSFDSLKDSYLYSGSIDWTNNSKNDDEAYAMTQLFYTTGTTYKSFDKRYNFGVRPVLTIKGDTLVVDGDGSYENPYSIGDVEKARVEDKVNTRYTGEYVSVNGDIYRIISVDKDDTTKVISTNVLHADNGDVVLTGYDTEEASKLYNPKQRGNIGYFINNQASQYIDNEYFVNKEIEVPIYKNRIRYGKEVDSETYKVRFAAPDIYEMFSGEDAYGGPGGSYWYINSSRTANVKAAMSNINVVVYGDIYDTDQYGVRVVGYLDEDCAIVRGSGTYQDPYVVTK